MCDVCVAETALWATQCGSKKCLAYEEGAVFPMEDAPQVNGKHHPFYRRLIARGGGSRNATARLKRPARLRRALYPAPAVHVRARGKRPEFHPASYQIRLGGEPWPREWVPTRDLAGSMGLYGLDVKWEFMPKIVQSWVLGRRNKPDEEEIKKSLGLPKGFDGAGRIAKNVMRLWPKRGVKPLQLKVRRRENAGV